MNVLEFNGVSFTYFSENGETQAVNNINFKVKQGQFVALLGPSGSGKTTILSLISGLLQPTYGTIKLYNKIATQEQNKKEKFINKIKSKLIKGYKKNQSLLQNETGYMFQKDHLFEWRTVLKNVLIGVEIQKRQFKKQAKQEFIKKYKIDNKLKRYIKMQKYIKNYIKQKKEYGNNLLKKYGLWEFRKKYPAQLSGGMRQRVALIRTLVLQPSILLLDEPFSALDYQTRLNLVDDVSAIIKNENKTTILVTHDITEALSMADVIIVLTTRPASIKNMHIIDIDKSLTPLQRRENGEFLKYFDVIWKEIQGDDNLSV